jgi:cell division septum initiation protein DivIVA
MSEDIVGQIKDIKGRTWQEAFYIQTKAFLEKNSEHLKEIERLNAEVVRLTKAGDAMASSIQFNEEMAQDYNGPAIVHQSVQRWNAAKEGKGQP